jgi:hypothetical protein
MIWPGVVRPRIKDRCDVRHRRMIGLFQTAALHEAQAETSGFQRVAIHIARDTVCAVVYCGQSSAYPCRRDDAVCVCGENDAIGTETIRSQVHCSFAREPRAGLGVRQPLLDYLDRDRHVGSERTGDICCTIATIISKEQNFINKRREGGPPLVSLKHQCAQARFDTLCFITSRNGDNYPDHAELPSFSVPIKVPRRERRRRYAGGSGA